MPQPAQDPIEEQMYLYEAVGLLISIDSISNAERANCVKVRPTGKGGLELFCAAAYRALRISRIGNYGGAQIILQPLLAQMQETLSRRLYTTDTPQNPVFCNLLHHHIMAVGSVAKGRQGRERNVSQNSARLTARTLPCRGSAPARRFPGASGHGGRLGGAVQGGGAADAGRPGSAAQRAPAQGCGALCAAGRAGEVLGRATDAWEAPASFGCAAARQARFLFQRTVGPLGRELLEYLPAMIMHLLLECRIRDVIDLMPVLSQLVYRFKARHIAMARMPSTLPTAPLTP